MEGRREEEEREEEGGRGGGGRTKEEEGVRKGKISVIAIAFIPSNSMYPPKNNNTRRAPSSLT